MKVISASTCLFTQPPPATLPRALFHFNTTSHSSQADKRHQSGPSMAKKKRTQHISHPPSNFLLIFSALWQKTRGVEKKGKKTCHTLFWWLLGSFFPASFPSCQTRLAQTALALTELRYPVKLHAYVGVRLKSPMTGGLFSVFLLFFFSFFSIYRTGCQRTLHTSRVFFPLWRTAAASLPPCFPLFSFHLSLSYTFNVVWCTRLNSLCVCVRVRACFA